MASSRLSVVEGRDPELLAWLYLRLKRAGLVEQIFHEGGGGLMVWLEWLCERSPLTLVALDDTGEPVGAGWVNALLASGPIRRAEVSAAFLPGLPAWSVVHAARQMLARAGSELAPCLLLATIPEPNRAAATLARRIGFRLEASIRDYFLWFGMPCRALIFTIHLQTSGDGPTGF